MNTKADLAKSFDAILVGLLRDTAASRTTLRLDYPERGMHVDDVAGEAVAAGVKSLRRQTAIDQRAAGTVRWLDRERRILVQDRLENADPAPPEALVQVYDTKAQMLAPVIRDGALQGWISVHYNPAPREWSKADLRCLEDAVAAVHAALDVAG